MVIRWPGVIKPGTVKKELFAALDWLPTLVEIAGGPKGNDLKAQIEKGAVSQASSRPPWTASTRSPISPANRTCRRATISSTTREPRRPRFATRTGRCTTRWAQSGAAGWFNPLISYHFTLVQNIKRDPFEQMVVPGEGKSLNGRRRSTRCTEYRLHLQLELLPIGQQLWEQHLMTYQTFPPMQAPETYDLSGILREMQKAGHASD